MNTLDEVAPLGMNTVDELVHEANA
jgi:hypothetical protein